MIDDADMTDRDLLRAWVDAKDADSLGVFLGRHQKSLLRFVSGFLADDHAAEDIVQETFIRVARHPRRLLDVASCRNWLLRVARNLSVDHVRGAVRRRRHSEALAEVREADARGAECADGAVADVERAETRDRVRAEIGALPPRLRELMLLKVEEGKSYKEIAEITGLTVTNVGYLLHQAMKKLAAQLRDLREGS